MVRVDGTSELLGVLRSQIASRAERLRGTKTESARTNALDTSGGTRMSIDELRKRIGRELGNFDLKLPAGKRRARLVFIESVLTWDFGDELLNDPQFDFLVRDVEESLNALPEVADSLDRVLSQLHGA